MEGTRPILAEIQALVAQSGYGNSRRNSNGIDYNRMCLIIAVLEKRLGLKFWQSDVYLNVIGGLRLEARQKLSKIRPENLGQAGRISGVSPADVAVLMVYLSSKKKI